MVLFITSTELIRFKEKTKRKAPNSTELISFKAKTKRKEPNCVYWTQPLRVE